MLKNVFLCMLMDSDVSQVTSTGRDANIIIISTFNAFSEIQILMSMWQQTCVKYENCKVCWDY